MLVDVYLFGYKGIGLDIFQHISAKWKSISYVTV